MIAVLCLFPMLLRRWWLITFLYLLISIDCVRAFELFHDFFFQEPPAVIWRICGLILFCILIFVDCTSGWRVDQGYNSIDLEGVVHCFRFCNCRWLLRRQLVSAIRVVRNCDGRVTHCIICVFSHLRLSWIIDYRMQFGASSPSNLPLSWMNLKNFTGLGELLLLLWLFLYNLFANDRCLLPALLLLNHFREWARVDV